MFNSCVEAEDGTLILYNTYAGALARIPSWEKAFVSRALAYGFSEFPVGILAELTLNGFFVPVIGNELELADELHKTRYDAAQPLELILMPNENCNFRCVYCYESFLRNKMQREVIEGIVEHVRQQAHHLFALRIGWFGGEPLTAPEIIEEISSRLQDICAQHKIEYSTSSMVTNGYLLTNTIADMLFRSEIRQFQITLDGPKEDHDRLRVLANKTTGTFDRILANLKMLRDRDDEFQVVVRVNFDPSSKDRLDGFIGLLERELGRDPRFYMDFHPVGRWGGPNDGNVEICGLKEGQSFQNHLFEKASAQGFDLKTLRQRLEPFGSVCYAANPRSFVIGSDGTVYKCTVAFEDPRNQVGLLTKSGKLLLDEDKLNLWINNGEEKDSNCRSCFFRPACQGNACPLERINHHHSPCPSAKTNIHQTLQVLTNEVVRITRNRQSTRV